MKQIKSKRKESIKRISTYNDSRFSQNVLNQHGCFLADGIPYEIEIISEREAIVKGEKSDVFLPLIDEYRFFTPHITRFYDEKGGHHKRVSRCRYI